MSTELKIDSRIIQKHDTEANWLKNAPDFIPEKSELIVYDIDDTHDYERMKIGDGKTKLTELPFQVSESELDERLSNIQSGQKLHIGSDKPSFACTWFRVTNS